MAFCGRPRLEPKAPATAQYVRSLMRRDDPPPIPKIIRIRGRLPAKGDRGPAVRTVRSYRPRKARRQEGSEGPETSSAAWPSRMSTKVPAGRGHPQDLSWSCDRHQCPDQVVSAQRATRLNLLHSRHSINLVLSIISSGIASPRGSRISEMSAHAGHSLETRMVWRALYVRWVTVTGGSRQPAKAREVWRRRHRTVSGHAASIARRHNRTRARCR
jgi:hypothetical protein